MARRLLGRAPFLDHRLFELALAQPPERKRDAETGKVLLRKMARRLLPNPLRQAPKACPPERDNGL